MANLALDRLLPAGWTGSLDGPFESAAKYFDAMDVLVYLEEDVAYRSDRVDPFLTLLWHPSKNEAIGVKLKGFRFLFERIQALRKSERVEESEFLSLVYALEVAITAGLGAIITADAEQKRINEKRIEKYAEARRLLAKDDPKFNARQMAMEAYP
jgi:hypothetical protein